MLVPFPWVFPTIILFTPLSDLFGQILNYNKLNKDFKRDIESALFHAATIFVDLDDSLLLRNTLFLQIANDHAPMKQVKVRSHSLGPWISSDRRRKINRRLNLYKKVAFNTNDNDKWREYIYIFEIPSHPT